MLHTDRIDGAADALYGPSHVIGWGRPSNNFNCVKKIGNSRYSRENIAEKKRLFSVEKIVIPKKMNITIINAEMEILKLKIAYRRKMAILQSLRRKNVGEKSEFYIIIERNISSVFRKRTQSFSTEISFFQ
jgi:hypothetical protein